MYTAVQFHIALIAQSFPLIKWDRNLFMQKDIDLAAKLFDTW